MPTPSIKLSIYLDLQAEDCLERIAQQELRSKNSTIAMLIRVEAARRGLIGRAPISIVPTATSDGS